MKLFNVVRNRPWSFILILGLMVCVGGLIVCGFQGCGGGSFSPPASPSSTPTSPPSATTLPAFPVMASGNHRYLQDQNGVPFPILGRTAWFITSLSETDYKMFLDDTAAKGYNAIELYVTHDPIGNNAPFAGNGSAPFTKRLDSADWDGSLSYADITKEAPDFSQPNETYWKYVDGILDYAESKGMLSLLFPAYTGSNSYQGWMTEMVANGATKMTTYGAFIANRYKARGNIVWMLGGDYGTGGRIFTPPELAVEKALLGGMKSIQGQQSKNFSAEWWGDTIYTDQTDPTLQAAGTLQGVYSFNGNVSSTARRGYDYSSPILPTFLLEEPYDQEGPPPDGNDVNTSATQPVRRFQWWGWLSGVGGYVSGNGYVWIFKSGWKDHLNTQGAQDMARLNAFIRSIAWYNLVPSGLGGMKTLVIAGGSLPDSNDYVAAAATPEGTLLVAYVPPDHSGPITVDMTVMSGPTRARWFDPTTAAYVDAVAGLLPPGTPVQKFTPPPGVHGDSFSDWVLLLEKQ